MINKILKNHVDLPKKIQFIFLLSFMIVTGLLSVYLGQDVNWDLQNYHYYNGYALLNLNIRQDFLAADWISYLNPYMDAINYLMIKYLPPKLTGFILGMIQGINFYLLAVMSNLLVKTTSSPTNRFIIITSISLLGLVCANVLGEVGTTFLDLTLTNLILLSVLIIGFSFKSDISISKKFTLILLAGIFMGTASALKMTLACYLGGGLVACLFIRKNGLKIFFVFLMGSILGFFLMNGYWMFVLWKNFQSPMFPLYNEFFKSPYFPLINVKYTHFTSHNIISTIFYPFYFSWLDTFHKGGPFRDFRLAFVYLLLMIFICKIILKGKIFSQEYNFSQRQFAQYLIIFSIISYVLWQYQFSVQRYIMPLDIIAPLLIYILLFNTFKNQFIINGALYLIFAILLITLRPMHWGRANWTQSYFDVKFSQPIDSKGKTGVVFILSNPLTYLRPFFPSNWHFTRYNIIGLSQSLANWSREGEYQFYILDRKTPDPEYKDGLKKRGISLIEPCTQIDTKLFIHYFLCPINLSVNLVK